jgi:hypothetical protein
MLKRPKPRRGYNYFAVAETANHQLLFWNGCYSSYHLEQAKLSTLSSARKHEGLLINDCVRTAISTTIGMVLKGEPLTRDYVESLIA